MNNLEIIRLDWQLDKSVDEETLDQWEQKTNYTLPADYRAFLLIHNGGVINPCVFRANYPDLEDDLQEMILDYLHDWSRVLKESDLGQFPPDLATQPPGYLLIGQDPGGSGILLSLNKENFGSVVYWFRSLLDWGDEENNSLGIIAPSFSAFLQSLYEDENEELGSGYWEPLLKKRPPVNVKF